MVTVILDSRVDRFPVFFVEKNDIVVEPITMPLFQQRLRRFFAITPAAPPSIVALQEGSVNGPRDKIGDGFSIHMVIVSGRSAFTKLAVWALAPVVERLGTAASAVRLIFLETAPWLM